MRESFIFYKSFYESIKELDQKDQVQIYNAIFSYQFENKEIELTGVCKSIFTLIIPQLEANNKRYVNGCKGGAPKGNTNALKKQPKNNRKTTENNLNLTKKQPNDNDNDNDNVNDNVNDNDNDNDISTGVDIYIYDYIENNFGRTLSPVEYEEISKWEDNELTRYAIKNAVLNGKCNIKYISRILESYAKNGIKTVVQAQNEEEKFKNQKEQKQKYQGMSFREQELLRQEEITKQWLEEG